MSFEGYYQVLGVCGHYTTIDCYECPDFSKWACPECGASVYWVNLVDVTNGSFDSVGNRIDGYVDLVPNDVYLDPKKVALITSLASFLGVKVAVDVEETFRVKLCSRGIYYYDNGKTVSYDGEGNKILERSNKETALEEDKHCRSVSGVFACSGNCGCCNDDEDYLPIG